jgi:hypothetical protein
MSRWDTRVQKIIEGFRDNEERAAGSFEGANMILIHPIGAKTGTVRVAPLVYFPQDDASLVATSGKHPDDPRRAADPSVLRQDQVRSPSTRRNP